MKMIIEALDVILERSMSQVFGGYSWRYMGFFLDANWDVNLDSNWDDNFDPNWDAN